MFGGSEDDTYIVNSTSYVVTKYTGEGIDTVQSSVSLTLAEKELKSSTYKILPARLSHRPDLSRLPCVFYGLEC